MLERRECRLRCQTLVFRDEWRVLGKAFVLQWTHRGWWCWCGCGCRCSYSFGSAIDAIERCIYYTSLLIDEGTLIIAKCTWWFGHWLIRVVSILICCIILVNILLILCWTGNPSPLDQETRFYLQKINGRCCVRDSSVTFSQFLTSNLSISCLPFCQGFSSNCCCFGCYQPFCSI